MNESIRYRELTMTLVCATCAHQYGQWRDRCPACGTDTPRKEPLNPPRLRRTPTRDRLCATQCIFCRQRGAQERCPHCNELIHRNCLGLHVEACAQFQIERNAILAAG